MREIRDLNTNSICLFDFFTKPNGRRIWAYVVYDL